MGATAYASNMGSTLRRWCAGGAAMAAAACATAAPPVRPSAASKPLAPASAVVVVSAKPGGSASQAAKSPSLPQGTSPKQAAAEPWHVKAPKVLAPLGPYPELKTPLPAECETPYVLAASAPAKMGERADWFWPWVVQALVANDHAFQLVASLDAVDSTTRAVHLQELAVKDKSGAEGGTHARATHWLSKFVEDAHQPLESRTGQVLPR